MMQMNQNNGFGDEIEGEEQISQQIIDGGNGDQDEEDVIDIDNPDELAKKGLKRI